MLKHLKKHTPLFGAVVLFAAAAFPVYGDVNFDTLDLNSDDFLLFTAEQNIPGTPSYKSLFFTHLGKSAADVTPQILTCFPEKMELLEGGKKLQVRNRYGTAIYSPATGILSWREAQSYMPVDYTHIGPVSASPDGKWECYVKQIKNAAGSLVLRNVLTNESLVLVDKCEFSYKNVNVKWAPDSSTLLYSSNEEIFFITPSAAFNNIQLPENYRKIGRGTINSVQWTKDGKIIYIDKDIIYSILENELYTRGLYSELVGSGTIIGRLPQEFSDIRDTFFVCSDGSRLVVISEDKILGYYQIGENGFDFVESLGFYPLTGIKGAPLSYSVFWKKNKNPLVWIDMQNYETGKKTATVFDLDNGFKPLTDIKGSLEPQLSPDGHNVAFTGGNSIYVYDVNTWKLLDKLSGEKIYSFKWASATSIYAGGAESVRLWEFDPKGVIPGKSTLLFLSSSQNAWWDGGRILVQNSSGTYVYDAKRNGWNETSNHAAFTTHIEKNKNFRVFTGKCQNSNFTNAIFVRSLSGSVITYPLYPETEKTAAAHTKVSLVFDAMDNAEGLSQILSVLDEFGIKGIFFVNGEFIRRYPVEVKQILAAGHECASSFYSTADLTSSSFVINADFIKRGLARNEDEFFLATGKELSLLWHAPFYRQNELMKKAGEAAGYRYVAAYNGISDRITFESSAADGSPYMDASALIDSYLNSIYDGMIIPVSAGKPEGTRSDYLYEKLDLLVCALLDSGVQIVPLRSLIAY